MALLWRVSRTGLLEPALVAGGMERLLSWSEDNPRINTESTVLHLLAYNEPPRKPGPTTGKPGQFQY